MRHVERYVAPGVLEEGDSVRSGAATNSRFDYVTSCLDSNNSVTNLVLSLVSVINYSVPMEEIVKNVVSLIHPPIAQAHACSCLESCEGGLPGPALPTLLRSNLSSPDRCRQYQVQFPRRRYLWNHTQRTCVRGDGDRAIGR